MAKNQTHESILESYPELEEADLFACLEFAAWSVSEQTIPVLP